jgi:hypothetical protein
MLILSRRMPPPNLCGRGGRRLSAAVTAEALAKLPPDLVPYEYCFNEEPWDRVFHVLFSDTD